ncbi:hypothetical protein PLICRDRAFT_37164 [Plicaturopsis crispa FD-325 SS-3]|nr:hypothetical protein PLICRDRAFT_37164 [Plicaturopsis crispa FD-325 SS-3]
MPITRSASRSAAPSAPTTPKPVKTKRKAPSDEEPTKASESATKPAAKRVRSNAAAKPVQVQVAPPAIASNGNSNVAESETFVPAVLTFSFKDAKEHLIEADHRFEEIFRKMTCKPFEQLEIVHPFRALTVSILGQQISWLAARSINHKFVRLFDPSLPEKPTDYAAIKSPTSFFPSPKQVAETDLATLRTAGLSGRKAEYVQDLAARFADGRLSTEKLLEADDEELFEMLTAVRGIGPWTVHMFAIFTLRRPNILPVGDLGVQRGMLRWFLAQHSPTDSYSLSPDKINRPDEADDKISTQEDDDEDALPVFGKEGRSATSKAVAPDASSIAPAPSSAVTSPLLNGDVSSEFAGMPTPFTPSINQVLNMRARNKAPPLPTGLTPAILKSRLDGKKKIKGALLTPQEMEELTEPWKPYRSLGVYYMWSLEPAEKE